MGEAPTISQHAGRHPSRSRCGRTKEGLTHTHTHTHTHTTRFVAYVQTSALLL